MMWMCWVRLTVKSIERAVESLDSARLVLCELVTVGQPVREWHEATQTVDQWRHSTDTQRDQSRTSCEVRMRQQSEYVHSPALRGEILRPPTVLPVLGALCLVRWTDRHLSCRLAWRWRVNPSTYTQWMTDCDWCNVSRHLSSFDVTAVCQGRTRVV